MAEYNDAGNDTDPENVDGDDPARDAIQSKPVRYQFGISLHVLPLERC